MRKPKAKAKTNPVEERLNQRARDEIAVLDFLGKHSATLEGISQAVNLSPKRVKSILTVYVGLGMVRKIGIAWRLTSLEESKKLEKTTQLNVFNL
jgi:hypothetical protein